MTCSGTPTRPGSSAAALLRQQETAIRANSDTRRFDLQFHRLVAQCAKNLPLAILMNSMADLAVDNSSMRVTFRGTVVETTALEFRVIEYLARHQGRVFTRNEKGKRVASPTVSC